MWQHHDHAFDPQYTALTQEYMANAGHMMVFDGRGFPGMNHPPSVHEFHGFRPMSSEFAGENDLTSSSSGFHNDSHNISCTTDSPPTSDQRSSSGNCKSSGKLDGIQLTTTTIPLYESTGSSRPVPARSPFEWMINSKRSNNNNHNSNSNGPSDGSQPAPGKTRTRDKYRVVYSDHQRVELEKHFMFSPYITIREKSKLAASLALSERQVKIWFQNRRAKKRKLEKKNSSGNTSVCIKKELLSNGAHGCMGVNANDSSPSSPTGNTNLHHSIHVSASPPHYPPSPPPHYPHALPHYSHPHHAPPPPPPPPHYPYHPMYHPSHHHHHTHPHLSQPQHPSLTPPDSDSVVSSVVPGVTTMHHNGSIFSYCNDATSLQML